MITEGVGLKAPQVRKVAMNDAVIGTLILEAKKRAEQQSYRSGRTQWKRGLRPSISFANVGTVPQEVLPIFVGFMGEYAINEIVRYLARCPTSVDFHFKRKGDGGTDLRCYSLRLQVKTCQKATGANLIRVREWGRRIPFTAQACAFCEWYEGYTVGVRGWCWWDDVKHLPEVSGIGEWMNIEVPSEMLLPANALVDEVSARREAWRLRQNGNH